MSEITLYTDSRRTTPTTIYENVGDLVQYDSNFWKDQNTKFSSTTSAPMSGYEGFNVKYSAQDTGTTAFKKFEFDNGAGETRVKNGGRTYITTYNNITFRGKLDERIRIASPFVPYLTAYDASDIPTVTTIGDNNGTVEVYERWPTDQAYASGDNDNGETIFSEDRIVWGYEPMTVYFTDASIARTFPISGWFVDYDDGNTESYTTVDPMYHPANSIVTHDNIFTHNYQRANTYYATLYNEASTTSTKSANVFRRASELVTGTLNTAVTARIDVYPYRQTNNFLLISGESVPSTYTDDSPVAASSVSTFGGTFISGYAPNLTVMFQESCTPISFPISSYEWQFGDVFRIYDSYQEVTASDVQTGFGSGWITDKTNHKISYSYKFPGLYNVSLGTSVCADPEYNPAFSFSLSSDVYSKNLLVYVKEIEPVATFGVSNVSAGPFLGSLTFTNNPMTVYFNASATVAGSYPIGRVVWDFGDGSFQTVLSSVSEPKPQSVTINHEYTRTLVTEPSTFNVTCSAYAYNTDTMSEYTITGLGPLDITPISAVSGVDWPVHLLAGSIYDNNEVLFVFEGNNKSTFNYLLTTGASS